MDFFFRLKASISTLVKGSKANKVAGFTGCEIWGLNASLLFDVLIETLQHSNLLKFYQI